MVNIECIAGKAEIFWESVPEDKYDIGGEEDKISLTSENSGKSHVLKIVPLTIFEKVLNLVFYVESDVRPNRYNFDELILDTSNYYMYSANDLHITFYTPIDKSIMNNSEYYDFFLVLIFLIIMK